MLAIFNAARVFGAVSVLMAIMAVHTNAQQPGGENSIAVEADLRRFDAKGNEFLPLAKSESAAQTRQDIYFATNRNPVPETDPTGFGNSVRTETRFGKAQLVSEAGTWRLAGIDLEAGELPASLTAPHQFAKQALSAEPRAGFTAMGFQADKPLVQFALRAAQAETDVLVFVHGAGHDFESALSTCARLSELYRRASRKLVAIVFTYPTNGISAPINYFLDRRDAGMSGLAMSEGFSRMVEFLGELRLRQPTSRIWFMAHSLGAYATRVAVQSIFERAAQPPRVFDAAFLMGADDDYDTLSVEAKMRPILRLTNELAVYYAGNDRLLQLSVIANLRPPIGLRGPRQVNADDFDGTTVSAVDAEAFSAINDRWRAHGYYMRSPRVIADVAAIIDGQSPATISGRKRTGERTFRLVE